MLSNEQLGVGFIGCGGHCCGSNIPCVNRNPKLKIIGFCDLRAEPLEELKAQYNPEFVTKDMEQIFADPEIQMVVCATKPDFRVPVMELAVKYKKALFVEKPIAFTKQDTEKMVELGESSKIPFIVGFNRPYSPMMQTIRPIYRRMKKGNTLIVYRIVGEGIIWPPEHRQAVHEKNESTIIHETTHLFDLLTWLTDLEPIKVYTVGGGNVDNLITLSYPDDIQAVIVAGDNGTVGYPKERIEINTNYSTIVGKFFVEMDAVRCGEDSGRKIFPYEWQGEQRNDGIRGVEDIIRKWRDGVTDEQREHGHYFGQTPGIDKGHYGQHEYFRQRIIDGQPIETDVKRGALANFIAWKALDSWENGQALDVDFSFLTVKR